MNIKVKLKSGFRSGGAIIAITGTFPNFTRSTLAWASECTWVGDADTSCNFEVDEEDPRPLFETWFNGDQTGSKPLNKAARDLCSQSIPKGWGIILVSPSAQVGETLAAYIREVAEGLAPAAFSPAQRREAYLASKARWIATWEAAGLNGEAIWAENLRWSKEEGVIALAAQIAQKGFRGHSRGHVHFADVNMFASPLSHPRTQSAERMAELSCKSPLLEDSKPSGIPLALAFEQAGL